MSKEIAILTCEKCGTEIQEGASFCPKCEFPLSVAQIGPVYVPETARPPETIPPAPQYVGRIVRVGYAGFWIRAVAFFFDFLILVLIFAIFITIDTPAFVASPFPTEFSLKQVPQFTGLGILVLYLLMWVYFAAFEASAWQATPGKRILKIYVTDLNGHRLTIARAALRNIARMISGILLVGYILAGFTEKKQALHDIIASCLVMRRS